jgi:hypothetical protein
MVYVGMVVVGLFGFMLGEAISSLIRNDASGRENNSGLTWGLKLVVAFVLMGIVFKSCS